ncbi:MAG: hypothetical protein ABSD78_16225 [Acidimicrobiales bacterium]|jgi:hypothetical protein
MIAESTEPLSVRLIDSFWAPRQAQLRDHTLPVLLDRLEAHGVVDNFRRLSGRSAAERRGLRHVATQPPATAFKVRAPAPMAALYRPADVRRKEGSGTPRPVLTVPYHAWANRGPSTMRLRFNRR